MFRNIYILLHSSYNMKYLEGLTKSMKEIGKDAIAVTKKFWPILTPFILATTLYINPVKANTGQESNDKKEFLEESRNNFWDIKIDQNSNMNFFLSKKNDYQTSTPDSPPPEINEQDMLNPYKEPNDRTLAKYGRGDVNEDGRRDSLDYQLMQQGDQSDMADIDLDGTLSTSADIDSFLVYINGDREYLMADYNKLQTPDERKAWFDSCLLLDGVDNKIIPYHDGTPYERFISGNFSYGTYKAIYGFMKLNPEDNDEHEKYAFIANGKFNGPMYMAGYSDPSTGLGHGMNAAYIGRTDSLGNFIDDPTDIKNWLAVEPQTNSTLKGSDWVIPPNRRFRIFTAKNFNQRGSPDMPFPINLIVFETDSSGQVSTTYQNPELITERPDWISTLPDALPPEITITSPEQDSTYTSHVTNLEYLVNDANPDSTWFSLDSGLTKTDYFGDSPITDIRSEQGENTWVVYHKDLVGHMSSDTVRFDVDTTSVGIAGEPVLPLEYTLKQNHPNPFNPLTKIEYTLPERGHVELNVYNAIGREVKTLVDEVQGPGGYTVNFSSENLPSGVYFYRLTADEYTEIKKMAVVK